MIQVYSSANCTFCTQAKTLLTSKNIQFMEIRIDEDSVAKAFILSEGHRTVPQIYKDGKLFVKGGLQGLRAMSESELVA